MYNKKKPKYKFSDYLTVVFDKDECLLAQGVLGEVVNIKKALYGTVLKNLNNKARCRKIENVKNQLKDNLIILPKKVDEKKMIKTIFSYHSRQAKKLCTIDFVLTLRCNFSCPYCFQNENKSDLKKEVASKVLSSFFRKIGRQKAKNVKINFFGGEPLLNIEILEYIVKRARAFCKRKKIKVLFQICTNGSIFNQRIVTLFSKNKDLSDVLVTIDGPQKIHDQRRCYKSGKGSYETIMKNLTLMCKLAKNVLVRINIDKANKNCMANLFRELKDIKKTNIKIFMTYVVSGFGKGKKWERSTRVIYYEKMIRRFYAEAKKIGLAVSARGDLVCYQPLYCSAAHAHPRLINPDGVMYCCEKFLGDKSYSVGNIYTGYDKERAKRWLEHNIINSTTCLKCKHIFFCGGPCLALAIKGLTKTSFCDKGFEKHLRENFGQIKKISNKIVY